MVLMSGGALYYFIVKADEKIEIMATQARIQSTAIVGQTKRLNNHNERLKKMEPK